ncbi:SubName: Full=Uncharacterized protein {ECO:0000313/EMBL:CCA72216.1} [Serendipita indica DSM 11827]|nr:SubName: Full=Uncharacterized protein {ECO:0000313/EMBL:CCA72216.1} [Serendipita indica DSM 11827]
MPKETSNTIEDAIGVKPKPKARKKPTGYRVKSKFQIWCRRNRERVRDQYNLSGHDIQKKLCELWWDAEENPNRGQRPEKKSRSPSAL